MDNSSNLTPPKWTTHLKYYRGKKSLKLYITIYKPKRVILITPLIGLLQLNTEPRGLKG